MINIVEVQAFYFRSAGKLPADLCNNNKRGV